MSLRMQQINTDIQTDYITSDILFLDQLGGRKSSPKQPYQMEVVHKARCSPGRKMKQAKFLRTLNCRIKPHSDGF